MKSSSRVKTELQDSAGKIILPFLLGLYCKDHILSKARADFIMLSYVHFIPHIIKKFCV